MPNCQLANELPRQIIGKFKKRKVYSVFRDNIWGVDLADMSKLSKYNRGIRYLLCAIDLFRKYVWVVPSKYKRGISTVNAFQKMLDSSSRKPNKIWVDQGGEFYNYLSKDFWIIIKLKCIQHIRTLKNKIFKHMTAVSKNVYFNVLDDIVNEYNNTVYRIMKMKLTDVTSDSYAECNEDSNEKGLEFKAGGHVRISKHKNIFAKGYTQNWSEEVFIISRLKIQFHGLMLLVKES